jgi:hypothetical protein
MRGQAHTLEGVTAALLLLSSVVFALEMTAVTPLSASTSSQHIENQQKETARGVLAVAANSGALKRSVLMWNESAETFNGTGDLGYYTNDPPPNAFGDILDRSFDRNGVAYNIYLTYMASDDQRQTRRLVYRGVPSDHAVEATWTVVLLDDDNLYNRDGEATGTTVADASSYFAPDTSEKSSVFNVVRVEVVAWRI